MQRNRLKPLLYLFLYHIISSAYHLMVHHWYCYHFNCIRNWHGNKKTFWSLFWFWNVSHGDSALDGQDILHIKFICSIIGILSSVLDTIKLAYRCIWKARTISTQGRVFLLIQVVKKNWTPLFLGLVTTFLLWLLQFIKMSGLLQIYL